MAKIVLGLQSTVDYEIVWHPQVIQDLVDSYGVVASQLACPPPVTDSRSLLVNLLARMQRDEGGEVLVSDSDVIEDFAGHFEVTITLGGTGLRAGIAMRVLGLTALLHLVSTDEHTRRLLPAGMPVICSAEHDTLDPHGIVQYPAGATVELPDAVVVTHHPNRVIFTNDPPARDLVISRALGQEVAQAEAFLVSGLNAIDDGDVLRERLASLTEIAARVPAGGLVMYEDAGFHVPRLRADVAGPVSAMVDVYSMNEDELSAYLERPVDLLDPADVVAAIGELRAQVTAPTVVVHSKYWALSHGPQAGRYRESLDGGITMASTRYIYGDGFDAEDYLRTASLPRSPAGARAAQGIERLAADIVCVPGRSLSAAKATTIGLGDTFVGGFIAAYLGATA
ncbi:MAG: ADP-dependent glucokinase/phosphofructokinase [Arachnia sp.]